MTFTGAIGAACMYPLRAIIRLCVALRIHPNTLTLIGVIINVCAAWALGYQHFMWAGVIMILAIVAVTDRIYYTYLVLNKRPMPTRKGVAGFFNRAFFWTDERATLAYDLWVVAILAFVWLTPPDWIGDPVASGPGLVGL